MTQKTIAARLQGDDYQGRFFWYQASLLLFPDSKVERVKLEDSEATYVDDVSVFYKAPGRRDGTNNCVVDFYQVKFHVDHRTAYCVDSMIDPSFIGSSRYSFLQRFFQTFLLLRDSYEWFTMGLVSNWNWSGDDELAKSIRHSGCLPDAFFQTNPPPRLRESRDKWLEHLRTDEATFQEFAKRLRLKLNFFGHSDFNAALSDRLQCAGLLPLDVTRLSSPYDDLARKFISSGNVDFDAVSLRDVCEREGLVLGKPRHLPPRRLGFRTFVPFAEVIESETSAFVCAADLFDGRHPRRDNAWDSVFQRFETFVEEQRVLLNSEHEILLDCHVSGALIAGYLFTTRAAVFPLGPRPLLQPQRAGSHSYHEAQPFWKVEASQLGDGLELVVAISVTHDISLDVDKHVQNSLPEAGQRMNFVPQEGRGPHSVRNAEHAVALSEELIKIVQDKRLPNVRSHLFIAAPNFFTFFLGQRLRSLGEVVVYEYDFDGPEPRKYQPAVRLPYLKRKEQEASHDSQN